MTVLRSNRLIDKRRLCGCSQPWLCSRLSVGRLVCARFDGTSISRTYSSSPGFSLNFRFAALGLVFLLGGCAWGYAGKETKSTETTTQPDDGGVVVVTLKKRDQTTQRDKATIDSPCGIDKFKVSKFNEETMTSHLIDCQSKAVVDTSDVSMTQPSSTLVSAGYPKDKWYVVVDPSGESEEIGNTVLLKLSREFDIEFYGQDTNSGMLVYLFLDEVRAP